MQKIHYLILQVGLASLFYFMGSLGWAHGVYDYYGKYSQAPYGRLEAVEGYHLTQGITKLYKGEAEYARGDFEFMLDYFPNHPQALKLMIETAFALKQPKLAQERIVRAIEMYPDTASTYMVYGVYLHRTHKVQEAVQQYLEAITLDPESSEAHYNLALAYLELKKYDLANWHAQRAYSIGSTLPGLRNRLQQVKAWDTNVDLTIMPDALTKHPSTNLKNEDLQSKTENLDEQKGVKVETEKTATENLKMPAE